IPHQFGGARPSEPLGFMHLREMADHTIRMVDTATEAFVRRDAESVRNIIEVDDSVDRLHDEIFQDIVRRMTDRTLDVQTGARYILVNRYLERIADHAVNIGMRVVYMVTGEWLPRVRAADRSKDPGRRGVSRPPL